MGGSETGRESGTDKKDVKRKRRQSIPRKVCPSDSLGALLTADCGEHLMSPWIFQSGVAARRGQRSEREQEGVREAHSPTGHGCM